MSISASEDISSSTRIGLEMCRFMPDGRLVDPRRRRIPDDLLPLPVYGQRLPRKHSSERLPVRQNDGNGEIAKTDRARIYTLSVCFPGYGAACPACCLS